VHDVVAAEPVLRDDERIVHDEKGHAYTWTPALDQKVDDFMQHAVQEKLQVAQRSFLLEGHATAAINARAAGIFAAEMRGGGDLRGEEALRNLYASDVTPQLEGTRASYADIVKGRQLNAAGEIERVFYDPLRRFADHGVQLSDTGAQATAIANYAAQRATWEQLHAFACQTTPGPGGAPFSWLEKTEADLVRRRALHGFHPTRSSDDYRHLTRELSRHLAVTTLQGTISACGGRAAHESHDHVTPTARSERDGAGRPHTLQSFLYEKVMASPAMKPLGSLAEHEGRNGEARDWLKHYTEECLSLTREHLAGKELAIGAEMDRAMASGRTRGSDPSAGVAQRLGGAVAADEAITHLFDRLENPPEIT
jgi:hypothetical protein